MPYDLYNLPNNCNDINEDGNECYYPEPAVEEGDYTSGSEEDY